MAHRLCGTEKDSCSVGKQAWGIGKACPVGPRTGNDIVMGMLEEEQMQIAVLHVCDPKQVKGRVSNHSNPKPTAPPYEDVNYVDDQERKPPTPTNLE